MRMASKPSKERIVSEAREVIQIAASSADGFFALCDDETIWLFLRNEEKWHMFPPMPATGTGQPQPPELGDDIPF
jgi:hypothetical protein